MPVMDTFCASHYAILRVRWHETTGNLSLEFNYEFAALRGCALSNNSIGVYYEGHAPKRGIFG